MRAVDQDRGFTAAHPHPGAGVRKIEWRANMKTTRPELISEVEDGLVGAMNYPRPKGRGIKDQMAVTSEVKAQLASI